MQIRHPHHSTFYMNENQCVVFFFSLVLCAWILHSTTPSKIYLCVCRAKNSNKVNRQQKKKVKNWNFFVAFVVVSILPIRVSAVEYILLIHYIRGVRTVCDEQLQWVVLFIFCTSEAERKKQPKRTAERTSPTQSVSDSWTTIRQETL